MSKSSSEIFKILQPLKTIGPIPDQLVGICSPQKVRPNHLVFCRDIEEITLVGSTPCVVVCDSKTHELCTEASFARIIIEDTRQAFVRGLELFCTNEEQFIDEISSSSCIAEDASIGKNVRIGSHCVIGKSVEIGDNCFLAHGVIIGDGCRIGSGCRLHSSVYVGRNCILGNNVQIHPHTTIGADGFGYIPGKSGHKKIPQIGNVVIEDDVEIGANCAIDRATIDSTIIGKGTKLDNLVHVAHNCTFGQHCMITAGYMTGGSTQVGDHVVTGGHVTVKDHISISSGVTIGGFSGVTNSIDEPGVYAGYPARPIKEFLKIQSAMAFLPSLLKSVRQLKKHLLKQD